MQRTCDLCEATGHSVPDGGIPYSEWSLDQLLCAMRDADGPWHAAREECAAGYLRRLERYLALVDSGVDPEVARRFSGVVYVESRTLEELRR